MAASFNGYTDVVKTLIEAKEQINTQEEVCCSYHQKTHIMTHSEVVLGQVTVCFCPQNGWTALHLAAQEGKVDVVRLLTEAQALVNIQTEVHTLSTTRVYNNSSDT